MAKSVRRLCAVLAAIAAPLGAQAADFKYLGQQIVPTGAMFAGTQVGGLSGIDYDAATGGYVAISDDRSQINPARFYNLSLDLAAFSRSNTPGQAGVRIDGVTTLQTPAGTPFPSNGVDPESIRLLNGPSGTTVLWTNEGLRSGSAPFQAPTFRESTLNGAYVRDFTVPTYMAPSGSAAGNQPGDVGIRNNLAFESLTLSPDQKRAYIATENALVQDGPQTSLTASSPSRVSEFDVATGQRLAEWVYNVSPIAFAPTAGGSADNGLVEMLALGEGRFLALERSFATGVGFSSRLFLADANGATDVSGESALAGMGYVPMSKTLLLDLGTLRNDDGSALILDNIEGITFGPEMNGLATLLFVSDNNFSSAEFTQFVAVSVDGLVASVPEPASWALLAAGGAMFLVRRRRTP